MIFYVVRDFIYIIHKQSSARRPDTIQLRLCSGIRIFLKSGYKKVITKFARNDLVYDTKIIQYLTSPNAKKIEKTAAVYEWDWSQYWLPRSPSSNLYITRKIN